MVIGRSTFDALVEHSRASFPLEGCGLLASQDGRVVQFYPMHNADESPVHFTLQPQEQLSAMMDMDDRDWELAAVYHSHTRTRAYPSETDVRFADTTSALYPDVLYVIVSLAREESPEVRWFRIADGVIDEVDVEVVDG